MNLSYERVVNDNKREKSTRVEINKMEIKIIAFGSIAELTGKEITVQASNVASLKVTLQELFPELADRKYAVAVNMKVVQGNLELKQNDTVALMPPFSGG